MTDKVIDDLIAAYDEYTRQQQHKSKGGEPSNGEQGKSEQGKSEPGKSESGKDEQGKSEQGKGKPGKSESDKSEPSNGEPDKSESGKSEQSKSVSDRLDELKAANDSTEAIKEQNGIPANEESAFGRRAYGSGYGSELPPVVIPEVAGIVEQYVRTLVNVNKAPAMQGRLNVPRYLQQRLNQQNIPVFVKRQRTNFRNGKVIFVVDYSGSMWVPVDAAEAGLVATAIEKTRASYAFTVAKTLGDALRQRGAAVVDFNFGTQWEETLYSHGYAAATEHIEEGISDLRYYAAQGYLLILLSDALFNISGALRDVLRQFNKNGGAFLIWFLYSDKVNSQARPVEPVFSEMDFARVYNSLTIQQMFKVLNHVLQKHFVS